MQIKNLHIILIFITFVMMVLASPIQERSNEATEITNNFVNSNPSNIDDEFISDSDDNEANQLVDDISVIEEDKYYMVEDATEVFDKNGHNIIDWSIFTAENIDTMTTKFIENYKNVIKQIEEIPDNECSFENVIAVIGNELGNKINSFELLVDILQYMFPDRNVRDAAGDAFYVISDFEIENYKGNKNIYHKIAMVNENIKNGLFKAPTEHEDIVLLERINDEFKSFNLGLSDEDSIELMNLEKKLSEITNEFNRCLNEEEEPQVIFTKDELEGVPEENFEYYEITAKDGQEAYNVGLDYTLGAVAKKDNTRKTVREAIERRCKSNVEILREIINIRLKIANLYGYKNHSSFKLENYMAKKPEVVLDFLNDLKKKLQPKAAEEMEKLLKYKKLEKEQRNEPFDNAINLYDYDYYKKILLQNEYPVNSKVYEYFPVNEVIEEVHKIYEEILSLKFVKVENPNVWYPDVTYFEVYDQDTNEFIGSFYDDLFPRDGKYTHTSSYPLEFGYVKEDGSRVYPIGLMIAGFSKPTSSKPSLLTHQQVIDYFHELGHIFHLICSENKWSRFNAWNSEEDFVETPALMLENWVWEPEIITRISHHYIDGSKMPTELVNSLIEKRYATKGIDTLMQVFYSLVDMELYSITMEDQITDPAALYNDLQEEVTGVKKLDGTWSIANFDHIVNEYNSGYYSYLWSQVYAADMYYSQFKKYGILNKEIGEKYRNILRKGSSYSAMDLLKEFLGKEPTDDAFVKNLGL